jgi:hypothetical protein
MSLKNLFSEDVQKILTPESLTAIQEAFDTKVELAVEAALLEQDDQYAEKLKTLITTIDQDRTKKMKKLVDAVDKNNASKLVKIVKLYERKIDKDLDKNGKNFKKHIVEVIGQFIDTYIAEAVSAQDIAQAVKNKSAYNILENMRAVLGVDVALMNKSIKGAVLDGKEKIDTLQKENTELKSKLGKIEESYQKIEVKSLLEEKTAKLPESKKNFIRKALQDKSVKFINENFDYTLRLFDKQEKEKLVTLKEEAINNRAVKPDVVPQQKVVEESLNNNDDEHGNMYVDELSKTWGTKK